MSKKFTNQNCSYYPNCNKGDACSYKHPKPQESSNQSSNTSVGQQSAKSPFGGQIKPQAGSIFGGGSVSFGNPAQPTGQPLFGQNTFGQSTSGPIIGQGKPIFGGGASTQSSIFGNSQQSTTFAQGSPFSSIPLQKSPFAQQPPIQQNPEPQEIPAITTTQPGGLGLSSEDLKKKLLGNKLLIAKSQADQAQQSSSTATAPPAPAPGQQIVVTPVNLNKMNAQQLQAQIQALKQSNNQQKGGAQQQQKQNTQQQAPKQIQGQKTVPQSKILQAHKAQTSIQNNPLQHITQAQQQPPVAPQRSVIFSQPKPEVTVTPAIQEVETKAPQEPVLIEAYVETVDQAIAAEQSGANRLELCGPGDGGLTPSRELLVGTLQAVNIPTHVMIRPRAGDFAYSSDEFGQMLKSIELVKASGAAGVVFGILLASTKQIDIERMRQLIETSRPMKVVCHKAFDETPNENEAIDSLLSLGVDEVLTSGHQLKAVDGAKNLSQYKSRAGSKLRIMAGGSVRAENIKELIKESGVIAVHSRATDNHVFKSLQGALNQIYFKNICNLIQERWLQAHFQFPSSSLSSQRAFLTHHNKWPLLKNKMIGCNQQMSLVRERADPRLWKRKMISHCKLTISSNRIICIQS